MIKAMQSPKKITLEEGLEIIAALSRDFQNFKEFLAEQSKQKLNPADELLTIEGASTLLHLSVETIRRYVRKREIPFSRKSKLLYFSRQELMDWVKQGRIITKQEADAKMLEAGDKISLNK